MTRRIFIVLAFALALVTAGVNGRASAQEQFHADVEIDPLAYVLRGHSVHVGLGYEHLRFDLGAFAADVPSFLESDDDFRTSASGFGLKFMVFPFAEQRGLFVGIDANLTRAWIQRRGSDLATDDVSVSTGVLLGVRIPLPAGFYVSPWIGVGYGFGGDDVTLGGQRYESNALTVFPTIHLGYQIL